MKFRILLLIAFLFSLTPLLSQELFQPGYFIDTNDNRVECLIKNEGWVDNPTSFLYKINPDDQSTKGSLDDVKEFSVGDAKFIRKIIDLDYSSSKNDKLSYQKEPDFRKDTLYLRYLVEGEASLLTYKSSDLRRFFLNKKNEDPISLIYKKYRSPDGSIILENTSFRRQMMQNIICGDVTIERLTSLRYINQDLVAVISEYNECNGAENVVYSVQEGKKIKVRIALRPGVRYANYETQRSSTNSPTNAKFDGAAAFRFGTEFEFLFPGNNQRGALLLEPVYQKFESTAPRRPEWSVQRTEGVVSYESIEFSVGFRYYFILSEVSRVFVNGLLILDKPLGDSQVQTSNDFAINSGIAYTLGLGYKYNDRYFAELRYGPKRDLLSGLLIDNNYNYISFILGFNVL